jgi:hypothetical protein
MERETCFLTKFSCLGLPFFEPIFLELGLWLLLVDCYMVHCPSFVSFALVSFWVSSSISHFLFPLHGYAMNCGGVLVYSRRYPKYSRLTLPWIPLTNIVLPCPGSWVIFHLVEDTVIISKIFHMITFKYLLISPSSIPKSDLVLSYNSFYYDPTLTSHVPKSHIVMSHNLLHYDSKSTSPVPKSCLLMSQNSSQYDPIYQCHLVLFQNLPHHEPSLTSPVPKSHFVLSNNSSHNDQISTSPVPTSHLVFSHNSSHYDSISTASVPKSQLVCPITHMVMI